MRGRQRRFGRNSKASQIGEPGRHVSNAWRSTKAERDMPSGSPAHSLMGISNLRTTWGVSSCIVAIDIAATRRFRVRQSSMKRIASGRGIHSVPPTVRPRGEYFRRRCRRNASGGRVSGRTCEALHGAGLVGRLGGRGTMRDFGTGGEEAIAFTPSSPRDSRGARLTISASRRHRPESTRAKARNRRLPRCHRYGARAPTSLSPRVERARSLARRPSRRRQAWAPSTRTEATS